MYSKCLQRKVAKQDDRYQCNCKVANVVVEAKVVELRIHAAYQEAYAHREGRSTLHSHPIVLHSDVTCISKEEDWVSQNCNNTDAHVGFVVLAFPTKNGLVTSEGELAIRVI